MKYQLAIFDSDGTLADTLPWMRRLYHELAARHGLTRATEEDFVRYRDLHGRELLRAINLPIWKVPRVLADMRSLMAAEQGKFSPFPGILAMLERLAEQGVDLGIVSSNSRANVERVLGPVAAGLIRYYDCGASVFSKARKVRRVIRWSRVPVERVIYIGDEYRDGEAAREAGIAFGAVAWGHHSLELLRTLAPREVFRTVAEMMECLGGISAHSEAAGEA